MSAVKVSLVKPLLILLYGFPGAGKTYFARNLSEHLNCAHVHSDRIRHELFEEPRFDKQENGIVKHLMNYLTEEFLGLGVTVIYDTNMMRKSQRRSMKELAEKKGAETLNVWFQLDPETAFNRLSKRDRRKTDDKFSKPYTQKEFRDYVSHMQHPEAKENYVVVSGKHVFSSQKSSIFNKFKDMRLMDLETVQHSFAKPGLTNLVPKTIRGRVDMSRRNIDIR